MRRRFASLAAGLWVLTAAAPALAAPTCWNAAGETVRCGTDGALPVGSTLSEAQEAGRQARSAELPLAGWLGLVCAVGGLFALIALMPDFEGWDGRQE
jgi:hypothetical protein